MLDFLQWGRVSKTDSVLTRHFDPDTGKERRERQVTIFLRRSNEPLEMVLDLAHELVHAIEGPSWDPYDHSLTPGKYIWESLEGEGGEIEALVYECRIAMELSVHHDVSLSRCHRYLSQDGFQIVKSKVRRDFYSVGSWRSFLTQKLGQERKLFPLLSSQSPQLYSSTGNTPYPVALYEEFFAMTKVACLNMKKRMRALRVPAAHDNAEAHRKTIEFLSNRCGGRNRTIFTSLSL